MMLSQAAKPKPKPPVKKGTKPRPADFPKKGGKQDAGKIFPGSF